MNINWYHSKHCKQNIFISSSKYGFYIPADLIFAVENEFKLNSCDVGLTDNGDMVLRFSKYGDGMYKVNMYPHGNNIEVCYCNKSTKCGRKAYDVNGNLIRCVRYTSRQMLFMLEETC